MLYTAAVTILALLTSVVMALVGQGVSVAVLHLAFAVGIVPLIFAAMSHFVPVLTRSGNPARGMTLLPAGAQAAGVLAILAMQGLLPRWLLHVAAGCDFVLAAILLGWISRRVRGAIGAPHPGWRWYGAALGCLLLTLAAVPLLVSVPGLYAPLRAFHLHLNTLGFVGLAALGTLPVLLPTAVGKPDPEAAAWLRRRLWPATGAALAMAVGAAFSWPMAVIGAAVMLVVVFGLAGQWWRRFGPHSLWRDGAAASLCAALAGLLFLLAAGVAHGVGAIAARPSIAAWIAGFLLPLVTGALSQLLPVWRWPGPTIPARALMRARLAATGRWRGLLFLVAGAMLLAGFTLPGTAFSFAGLGLFALGVIRAVRVAASAR